LKGHARRLVDKILKPGKPGFLLSADLTTATDLLPLDFVDALVTGMLSAKGASRA